MPRRVTQSRNLFDADAHRIRRNTDPQTSHQGAREVAPRLSARRIELMQILSAYRHGLTQSEADEAAGYRGRVLGKRANELERMGLAETFEARRCRVTGRRCLPYRLTKQGRDLLAALCG